MPKYMWRYRYQETRQTSDSSASHVPGQRLDKLLKHLQNVGVGNSQASRHF